MVTVMQSIPAVIHRNVRIHSERRWTGVKHDVSRPWIVRQVCSRPMYVEPVHSTTYIEVVEVDGSVK